MFDPMRLTQGLDDLVAWRAALGNPTLDLRVEWSVVDGEYRVFWDEPPARAAAARPATTASTTWESQILDAFAVPLLTRIMASHGGSLETDESPSEGWRLTMRWPLDARPTPRETTSCLASSLPR